MAATCKVAPHDACAAAACYIGSDRSGSPVHHSSCVWRHFGDFFRISSKNFCLTKSKNLASAQRFKQFLTKAEYFTSADCWVMQGACMRFGPPPQRLCREWVVHEDEALAYQLQKQEVESHYIHNKQRNALVREDFPKAKEEQEKEIVEAAEKYRQMVWQQEKMDSTYARRIAEKLEREEFERRQQAEIMDEEMAKKIQAYEIIRNANSENNDSRIPSNQISTVLPDVNKVGLPIVEKVRTFHPVVKHHASVAVTHNLRNLRLSDDNGNYAGEIEKSHLESCSALYSNSACSNRTPTPATLLPEDLNDILTDVDLQEEANRRLLEEKDAELARMLQKQEEEILHEEVDRDRLIAIEAQDKELAKLLYEKEKAKLKRAKERARQKALLKKQQIHNAENSALTAEESTSSEVTAASSGTIYSSNSDQRPNENDLHLISEIGEDSANGNDSRGTSTISRGRTSAPLMNVAMHIDPTYFSQTQSSSMPNSLIFQDGDGAAPPYMPIQGQRRYLTNAEKKTKKSKSKDGCKQQ
ncbi:hypothetical protein V9T40_000248 [Parthenolecanium corni]|uniref:Coiled-coil domain-containing protein n=1 Tax=Parthenolecanium corni TaxID=536013 RepID=A0AAN9TAU2_9HEMI